MVFPSILIQLENGPNEFYFIFISSSDTNLLRKKSVKQKIIKQWPYLFSHMRKACFLMTHMSLVMRKPAFCICENKDADQLRGNREADQRLCFRYSDSMIPLLSKSKISRL